MKQKTWYLLLQLLGFLITTAASVEALLLILNKPIMSVMPETAVFFMAMLIASAFFIGIYTQLYAFQNNPVIKKYL